MVENCVYSGCRSNRVTRAGFSNSIKCLGDRKRQRYRCLKCRRRFNDNAHSFGFGLRKSDPALNAKIFYLCMNGLSNRGIARTHYISEHCVRLRLRRMARRAMSYHHNKVCELKIAEELCFDGLENFAKSQYDVNNIQQAIGRDSLFIYDFNYAPLNRKGKMSIWQKQRLAEIEAKFGRYNPRSIRIATKDILERLSYKRCLVKKHFTVLSDEHFQYRRVVKMDLKTHAIEHITISSKACRNFQNILFNVNHADLVIRQQVKAFARETISFSKTAASMCQKYALFMVHKNYMTPQFTKVHVRRPLAHLQSPAQSIGLTNKIAEFGEIFSRRSMPDDQKQLNPDWQCFWADQTPVKYHRHHNFVRKN